jgi:hypothetical protein
VPLRFVHISEENTASFFSFLLAASLLLPSHYSALKMELVRSSATSVNVLFFYLVCEAIGTAATPGLLCQPRVIMKMIVEK